MFTGKSLFDNSAQIAKDNIANSQVVFVADVFADEYLGGAELTTEALFESADVNVCKIKSNQVTAELVQAGIDKHWVFFNYSAMNADMIPPIIANLHYSIVEYDYKFCKYRSIEKHKIAENADCDCHNQLNGKMISAFMFGAEKIFWMSESQKSIYLERFPFLSQKNSIVLSSILSSRTIQKIKNLRVQNHNKKNNTWIVIGSPSWVKGAQDSEKYCVENNLDYEVVWNLNHDQMLEKLAKSKGHVYLPPGGDTCPRAVIEAKLLDCELVLNDNVQHRNEGWFLESCESVEDYIISRTKVFWKSIHRILNKEYTVSGYTTTRNCIEQKYPFREAIKSMLNFCDQVVVVDGGSTDGTWEELEAMSKIQADGRLIVEKRERDWNHKRFAVFDGLQKAYARSLCTGDWCWQMDSDEIVHESDYTKIRELTKKVPKSIHLINLPVIEYWGGPEKIRIDVNPWKWRLSRNHKHITHGIPKQLRMTDAEGNLYAQPGTDGCDYIDAETYEVIPSMGFYTKEIHSLRITALSGDQNAVDAYENWFNNLIENLPGVHHYSWYNLERKIHTYKNYWSKHWQSLYDITQTDTVENNMFFNKPWREVSDEEIKNMAKKLKDKMGGWVFHNKVDFEKPTPFIMIERSQPEVMNERK